MFHKGIMLLLLDKFSSHNDVISRNKYTSTGKQSLKGLKRNPRAALLPEVKEVRTTLCWLMSVENSVKLSFFGLSIQMDKNTAEAVCDRFVDLDAGRRSPYKCLLMFCLHVFFGGWGRACVNKTADLWKICFLLHEINIHRFLLLIVVSL